jgi:hypothetical protein
MSVHPTLGVAGAKPRLPKAESNGEPASKAELARLSQEYLRSRNLQMAAKTAVAQMELERRRAELIPKKAVKDMIGYTLVCFRQRTLLSYRNIAQRLRNLNLIAAENEHTISLVIQEEARSLLNELGRMSEAVDPESGLKELAREEFINS